MISQTPPSDTLIKIEPTPCSIVFDDCQCANIAHWEINGQPVCDTDIKAIAAMNSDNEAFLQPALQEIKQRSTSK
ncbi:MAG TPA: hypothetical protein VL461_13575 [Dictyobacter sp.]|nr:hypothetical protein [Dictyobacter sp.]